MHKKLFLLAVILWSGLQMAMAQGRSVKGQVKDEKGEGIPGASVQVKGSTKGTITDLDGNFTIDVEDGKETLIINAIGYTSQEMQPGADGQMAVKMKTATKTLDEAVVVGYGTEKRKTLIGGASTIKGEEFKDVPMGSFTNMLQGKAAGVQITGSNGAPGSTAYIRIRGAGSISAGNDPLIVIDGVPVNADAYNALNPNDIADVSVLKDASTTAIYGSRGSNGVIMVTTKKGTKKGSMPQITYGFQYGFKSKTPDKFRMMNFDEKLRYERDLGFTNQYLRPLLKADGFSSISDVPDPTVYWDKLRPYATDWQKELLRTGKLQQHDLSVNGSSEKIDYFFSMQSYDEDGISLGSSFNRKSGNIGVDYRLNDWIKVGQNINVSYSKTRRLRDINNVQSPFTAMYTYNPYESPYDFGPKGLNGYNLTSQGFNVVEAIQNNPSFSGKLYGLSSTYLELNPIKDLTLRSQLGMQYTDFTQENFTQPGSILDLILNGTPTGNKTDLGTYVFNYVWSNTAQYRKTFNDVHNFTLLVGTEFTKENVKNYSLSSKGYVYPDLTTQNNGATPVTTTTSRTSWALMSYFARVQYNYAGKYLANVSVRSDGSSRFGEEKKYGTFIAGGLAWNITEEDFLKGNNDINNLKLWGSLGTSGNDKIGDFAHIPLYTVSPYNNQSGIIPNPASPGNESLVWEKNTNYSVGLDFGFFNNRLTGTVDVYNKYTHGLLLWKPLSYTVGYTAQLTNVGNVRNTGMELLLNYDIIRNKDFQWSVGGNLTLNKNRVVKLLDDKDIPDDDAFFNYLSVNKPIDVYYLQKYAGIDPANGNELWYKKDGTVTSDYNEAGLFLLDNKSPNPTFFGGFNTNVAYKGIQLGVDFTYSGGNYIYNIPWRNANTALNVNKNMAADALDYWTPTNTNSANPAPNPNNPYYDSDRWLQKGNFIRLRNVTLAYNLPQSIISKAKMQAVRVYVQGQNLWYSAPGFKGDPEVGISSAESAGTAPPGNAAFYSYPQTKAITFGVNVTF